MRFVHPYYLAFIPVAGVLLVMFRFWIERRKKRTLARFGNSETVERLRRGISIRRDRSKYGFFSAAVLLLLLSIARPQYGTIERPLRQRGVEVMIAIDCSRSMMSTDVAPNRLARAREQLRELIYKLQGNGIGVIAFAGIPIVQCPLTSDYEMALNLLDSIDVDTVPVQGTAIGKAIEKAVGSFRMAGKGYRILVLLTDGEDMEGKPLDAAKKAAAEGVRIYAIGIGSTQGSPVPLSEGGFKEENGRKVNSRLNFETLRQIAGATGGLAFLANAKGHVETDAIAANIAGLKDTELKNRKMVTYEERFQYFLFPAILLLALEMVVAERKKERKA